MEKRLVHDYPRLAKESGFNFCFRLKRVNWSKLDELDVEDIAFRGKYDKLESCIDLILNCELDEDVTKVLDKNFVKLFRLAQISVGYLRHCLLYLDQCVVLLQDKLSTALEKTGGLNVLEKDGADGFECEKCQKVFLTATYLAAHRKRRHNSPERIQVKTVSVHCQTEPEKRLTVSVGQQTDVKRTFNVSTQTAMPKSFEKGVMADFEKEASTDDGQYNEKLHAVLKRLEVIEAKSDNKYSNENGAVLQYLQSIVPLITAPPINETAGTVKWVKAAQIPQTEPFLIDLNEPEKNEQEKLCNEEIAEENPVQKKPRLRRIKISSPLDISEEEESIQQPVPKPRTQTFSLPEEKLQVLEVEEPKKEVPRLIVVQDRFNLKPPSNEKTERPACNKKMNVNEKIDWKLRELGIDPEWTRLPDDSFQNVMQVLQHQIKNPVQARLCRELESKVDSMMNRRETKVDEKTDENLNKTFMYDTDTDKESLSDFSDIKEIPIRKVGNQTREIAPVTENAREPARTTDLSIFQVTGLQHDSGSDESEPIKIKSSLMIKNKEEPPKKRVVFADNFILETNHDKLLDIDRQSSSSSNSWDLPTA